jgi:hypothetical protein
MMKGFVVALKWLPDKICRLDPGSFKNNRTQVKLKRNSERKTVMQIKFLKIQKKHKFLYELIDYRRF